MKEEMNTQRPATYDITNFTIREATGCGKVLRKTGEGARSMEEVAGRVVRHLYDSLVDGQTGMRPVPRSVFLKPTSMRGSMANSRVLPGTCWRAALSRLT